MRDTIEMAREAGIEFQTNTGLTGRTRTTTMGSQSVEAIERLVALARADEREACAKVAGWLWQQFQDTKDAHERLSPAPFRPSRFGFDESTVQQSKRMMDAIRARGETK